jgi:hypothetical protein
MSFADHAVLWLHVTAAVFTIGPGTAAIMSTPRYIRRRNPVVIRYLFRTTRIYSFAALLTLIFGVILTGLTHKWSQWWISVSLTLFVVAFVLLLIIMRDQRKALAALNAMESAAPGAGEPVPAVRSAAAGQVPAAEKTVAGTTTGHSGTGAPGDGHSAVEEAGATEPGAVRGDGQEPAVPVAADLRVGAVERGRIASFGGVTALIWLVILVLMVWH